MPDKATPLTAERAIAEATLYERSFDSEGKFPALASTLRSYASLIAERDDLKANAEKRRVIFDEALEHLKTEPVHLVLFESNVRLRERIVELQRERDEARAIGGLPFDEWADAANIPPRDRRAALLGWNGGMRFAWSRLARSERADCGVSGATFRRPRTPRAN